MHGLVSQIGYPEFGNPAKDPSQGPSDNDGLWTAMLLAAESFRYSVTGDERAKVNADHMFNGSRLLQDVTGQRGLLGTVYIFAINEEFKKFTFLTNFANFVEICHFCKICHL
jgi:hypothetical protein